MAGVQRKPPKERHGRAFPHSRYNDPRGGRPSALERNILRYRAAEVTLYLFYAEEIRKFLRRDILRSAIKADGASSWRPTQHERKAVALLKLINEAESADRIPSEEAEALRHSLHTDRQAGKQLRTALGHAVKIGMYTDHEADELHSLLDYRNDIAHRIHLMMYDVSRDYWAVDHLSFSAPLYKGQALDRLRVYRESLWERTPGNVMLTISMSGLLFETAERVYEGELKRLDGLIQAQIQRERKRAKAINAELDLSDTELVNDLSPRFLYNFYHNRDEGPDSGHLTKRGVEICYRLYDLGKSPIAVAYLMGISLRAAQRRQRGWTMAGGNQRAKASVQRYLEWFRKKTQGSTEQLFDTE
jgi:hypothetical protein